MAFSSAISTRPEVVYDVVLGMTVTEERLDLILCEIAYYAAPDRQTSLNNSRGTEMTPCICHGKES